LRVPPHLFFVGSAIFHYLGPSFAVLLFPAVGVLGVAWLRIASAALVFAPITRPWRLFPRIDCSFYLALARLPISLVAAIEFVGSIALALYGLRTSRNFAALAFTVGGVFMLIGLRWASDVTGLLWAALNGVLFVLYVVLGHRIANKAGASGIERLGSAMAVAFIVVFPIGILQAAHAFSRPLLLLAGIGVGICSSVIPYVCDQLAMARLSRATFALMLALLPACATIIGALVLRQIPSVHDVLGIALVMGGVAIHQPPRNV
jgi:inner membrane transporter RhtA